MVTALVQLIGTIGAVALGIAWLPETYHSLKYKKSTLDPKFTELMFLGVFLLTFYSLAIQDMVFLGLNIFILANIIINMYYEFFPRKKRRKHVKR